MPPQLNIPTALRKAGVAVVLEPGWESRGNPSFRPRGVVCHHTGPGSTEGLLRLVKVGRPDLPGPLCNIFLSKAGVAHVVAAGRANHAGAGTWQGLEGNGSVFGIEAEHPGDRLTEWPPIQVEAYEKVCAGLLTLTPTKDPALVCAHFEWAPLRKIDPARFSMRAFRARVDVRLQALLTSRAEIARKVAPMYDPPLGPLAGVWQDPATHQVIAAVAPDGSVFAWGCEFRGAPAGKDYWQGRRAAEIIAGDDQRIPADRRMVGTYAVVATSGEIFGPGAF